MPTTFSQVSEVKTSRQIQVLLLRSNNPNWGRRDFAQHLRRSWVTVGEWDKRLLYCLDDYSFDPGTGEPLWAPRQPWNAHQQWVLKKIKIWMSRSPKPSYEDLEIYVSENQHLYNHEQFFKELEEYYAIKRACENTQYPRAGVNTAGQK